jgi:GNAT superfamily N-acetyltransferase
VIPASDLALSRRLERAEGHACAMFAEARRRIYPESGAEWMEHGGALAVFNGIDSPVTQSFGLGIFENLDAPVLDAMESFFFAHGTAAVHEVSPLAGVAALDLLCRRQYGPVEISNVMYRAAESSLGEGPPDIYVRVAARSETAVWTDVMTRGWLAEYPGLRELFLENGAIGASCEGSVPFLAGLGAEPGAAATLCIHEGVALLGGAATVPEMRRKGLQTALIAARIRYAFEHGCDLLMMVAEPGSNSQRNAERNGFRVAYTRTKWRLAFSQKPAP